MVRDNLISPHRKREVLVDEERTEFSEKNQVLDLPEMLCNFIVGTFDPPVTVERSEGLLDL